MGLFSLLYRSKTFCFCLPVRLGVLMLTFLSIIVAGILMLVLWYEVATASEMSSSVKPTFVLVALLETLYCLCSILGFVGAVVRKQLFVVIYAYFIYTHLLIHVGIGLWFIWMVTHTANTDIAKACRDAIRNEQARGQCDSLLDWTHKVFVGLACVVLLIEMYCAVIVACYVYQLKLQKRNSRASRLLEGSESGRGLLTEQTRKSGAFNDPSPSQPQEFNPYAPYASGSTSPLSSVGPHPDPEQAYGGGRWTHQQIADAEKRSLHELERQRESTAAVATVTQPSSPSAGKTALLASNPASAVTEFPRDEELPPYDFVNDGREVRADRKL